MTSPIQSSPVRFQPVSQSLCSRFCNFLRSLFSIFSRCMPRRAEQVVVTPINPNRVVVIPRQSAAYEDPEAEAAIDPNAFQAVHDPLDVQVQTKPTLITDLEDVIAAQDEIRNLSQKIYSNNRSVKEVIDNTPAESKDVVAAALANLRRMQGKR
jgi:hypothetical protein